ncbi:MAG: hypothetical protein J07HX5_02150 [halophilic archaeon J07HX5]|nr:MAG: hypothetical protein J07HX5_02150 [halophilic archaeon J07HX5]
MPADDQPAEAAVVDAAAAAAEQIIFSRYDRSAVRDLDITVQYRNKQLEVDVYLDVADDNNNAEQVADDAALAARGAADSLLE